MTRFLRTFAPTCLAILGMGLAACDRAAAPDAESAAKESSAGKTKGTIHLSPEAIVSAGITLGAAEVGIDRHEFEIRLFGVAAAFLVEFLE